ncbi:MAG: (d)CMP kinase [Candidatus Dormibacteria bacterium]
MSVAVVTVDGPAGSGKSTLGRRLAGALGLAFIDTGLFYRAITVAAVRGGLGAGDLERIVDLARTAEIEVNTDPADESWEVRVDGADGGAAVRDPRHAALLTTVSQLPGVRRHLLPLQRAPAGGGAVAVGRDCGTVVFPDAVVKLYLEATETLRAERRAAQLARRGAAVDHDTLAREIGGRDLGDAPAMAAAPDAVVIDTGSHGVDEMVEVALRLCAGAGLRTPGRGR